MCINIKSINIWHDVSYLCEYKWMLVPSSEDATRQQSVLHRNVQPGTQAMASHYGKSLYGHDRVRKSQPRETDYPHNGTRQGYINMLVQGFFNQKCILLPTIIVFQILQRIYIGWRLHSQSKVATMELPRWADCLQQFIGYSVINGRFLYFTVQTLQCSIGSYFQDVILNVICTQNNS